MDNLVGIFRSGLKISQGRIRLSPDLILDQSTPPHVVALCEVAQERDVNKTDIDWAAPHGLKSSVLDGANFKLRQVCWQRSVLLCDCRLFEMTFH